MVGVLSQDPLTRHSFDILSEHAYSQLSEPDTAFPARMNAVKSALANASRSDVPIWHSEQGLTGNDDGCMLRIPALSLNDP